jgi:bifunctional DNase/RNase
VNSALTAFAAACIAAAVTLAAPAHPSPVPMVEMEVAGVFSLDDAHAGVLVLREKEGATMLPIVVGSGEAEVVQKRLRNETTTRPRTHDLLEHAIDALGAKVVRVEIRDASETLYRARVFLAQGAQRVELDARPSDSIALAVSARAPIFAAKELLQGAGLSREDLDRLRRAHSGEPSDDPAVPPEQHM